MGWGSQVRLPEEVVICWEALKDCRQEGQTAPQGQQSFLIFRLAMHGSAAGLFCFQDRGQEHLL